MVKLLSIYEITPDSQTQNLGIMLSFVAIVLVLIASKSIKQTWVKVTAMFCFWFLAVLLAILSFYFHLLEVNVSENFIIVLILSGLLELLMVMLKRPACLVVFGFLLAISGLMLVYALPDILNPILPPDVLTRIKQFGEWFFRML